ncbi:MAG: MMPL family transporter, partial [Acidobacteria bacterium]|nr:MMPL family transporter [Acidobacteriota bacterium]
MAAVLLVVRLDLAPRVEADFFFATDDPQMQSSAAVDALFPSRPQILLQAAGDPGDEAYVEAVGALTEALESTLGVKRVYSLTSGPSSPSAVESSPLWRRLLLPGGEKAAGSLLIAELGEPSAVEEISAKKVGPETPASPSAGEIVTSVEALVTRFWGPDSAIRRLEVSGVPYVVEHVRRRLLGDLKTFSLASLLLFGLAVALVFRSWPVVGGTLATCALTCAASLAALRLLGVPIGLLTANLATIVFVLTLSHGIFLTAAFRRAGGVGDEAVRRAVRETFPASFWCMATTLLGFSSLLFTSARPMRELGLSGAVGTVLALISAFSLHPVFLYAAHLEPGSRGSRLAVRLPRATKATVASFAAL